VKNKARILSALWFLMLVNYLDRVAMGFAGPSIMKSLSISPSEFGVVLSSFGVGYLLAQLPGGFLADRWGAKTLLVVGPLLWTIFTGATALVAGVTGFVLVRLCFGISEGVSNTSLYKTIGDHFDPKERARALAFMSTAVPLAPVFAGGLIGALVGSYGWQAMFLLMMVPSLLAALGTYLLIPATRSVAQVEATAAARASFLEVISHRSLWLIAIASFAWNIPYWGFLGWMPSYLALQQHIDLKAIGLLGAIPYAFAFVGMLLVGWLGSTVLHRHNVYLIIGCFLAAALSLFLAYQAHAVTLALAGLSSAAFFLFGTHGPIGRTILDLAPEQRRATYIGVYTTVGQIGGIVAPAAIGFMVSATGTFASGFALMIGGFMVAVVCLLALIPLMPARSATGAPA
jgi:MFS family permease